MSTPAQQFLGIVIAWALSAFAANAFAQEDVVRRAEVDRVFAIADAEVGDQARGEAVQRYLDALPRNSRAQLEADIWWRLRADHRISRAEYIQHMLDHNQNYAPDDFATLDYWRYLRVINNRFLRGEIDQAEFSYLSERKLEAVRLQHQAAEAAERSEAMARSAAEIQLRQAQQQERSAVLRAIGEALRPPTRTECYQALGTLRCTTR